MIDLPWDLLLWSITLLRRHCFRNRNTALDRGERPTVDRQADPGDVAAVGAEENAGADQVAKSEPLERNVREHFLPPSLALVEDLVRGCGATGAQSALRRMPSGAHSTARARPFREALP